MLNSPEFPQPINDPDFYESTEDQYIDPNEMLVIESIEVLELLVKVHKDKVFQEALTYAKSLA